MAGSTPGRAAQHDRRSLRVARLQGARRQPCDSWPNWAIAGGTPTARRTGFTGSTPHSRSRATRDGAAVSRAPQRRLQLSAVPRRPAGEPRPVSSLRRPGRDSGLPQPSVRCRGVGGGNHEQAKALRDDSVRFAERPHHEPTLARALVESAEVPSGFPTQADGGTRTPDPIITSQPIAPHARLPVRTPAHESPAPAKKPIGRTRAGARPGCPAEGPRKDPATLVRGRVGARPRGASTPPGSGDLDAVWL
jgi:hypothetical protein